MASPNNVIVAFDAFEVQIRSLHVIERQLTNAGLTAEDYKREMGPLAELADTGQMHVAEYLDQYNHRFLGRKCLDGCDIECDFMGQLEPIQATHDYANKLFDAGRACITVTNAAHGAADRALELGLIPSRFDGRIVESCIERVAKPNPRIIERAQKLAGIWFNITDPYLVLIDDKAPNVAMANALPGCEGFLLDPGNPQDSIERFESKYELLAA